MTGPARRGHDTRPSALGDHPHHDDGDVVAQPPAGEVRRDAQEVARGVLDPHPGDGRRGLAQALLAEQRRSLPGFREAVGEDDDRVAGRERGDVLDQWRRPAHEAFAARNAFSLWNAFTEVFKGINPHTALRRGEALHGLFDAEAGVSLVS